jgi:hexosaminidase
LEGIIISQRKKVSRKSFFALLFVGTFLIAAITGGILYSIKYTSTIKYPIIPRPSKLDPQPGEFEITQDFSIYADNSSLEVTNIAEYFATKLGLSIGWEIEIQNTTQAAVSSDLLFILLPYSEELGDEGYFLTINDTNIVIAAGKPLGLFHGVQSLLQLFPPSIQRENGLLNYNSIKLPCVKIQDAPRFPYRGMHLDVGRHFFPIEFIKKYLDLLAFYKYNTFHWHLTEDQGWRIEIKNYSLLTDIGAYRDDGNGGIYGGYYTQEEIREVVEFASKRYITVIPEIEMPGHSVAALAAYPNLSCTGGPFNVSNTWGVHQDVYCAGNEETFAFLETVLIEVMNLFPSKFIHIGGDECPKTRWEECPKCQARIVSDGLADEHELQSYFISRINSFIDW